jgi:hypothetical protein
MVEQEVSHMIRRNFAVALGVVGVATITGTSSASGPSAATTPTLSGNWVLAPGGYVPAECFHQVPNGAKVTRNAADGSHDVTVNGQPFAHYDPCPITLNVPGKAASGIVPAAAGGWIEGAQRIGLIPNYDYITSTWYVPSNPTQNGGTVFLFNGLEPDGGGAIIQPVLQWGPSAIGGGNYWGIAPWYVDGGTVVAHGPLERVSAGDEIVGYVYSTSENGRNINWANGITDNTSGAWSEWNLNSYGWTWGEAFLGIMEAYNISNCAQLPQSDYEFVNNYLYQSPPYTYVGDGSVFSAVEYAYNNNWTPSYQGPYCGFITDWAGSNEWIFGSD